MANYKPELRKSQPEKYAGQIGMCENDVLVQFFMEQKQHKLS